MLLRTLIQNSPVHHGPPVDIAQSPERARQRYERALLRLRDAGIPTREDPRAGAREYAEMRASWEPGIEAVAPALGFSMREVDTAGHGQTERAAAAEERLAAAAVDTT